MSDLALIFYLAPLSLAAVPVLGRADRSLGPTRLLAASRGATLLSLALSVLAAIFVAAQGPVTSPLLGSGELGLSLRLDALSVAMFVLVAFVGVLVVQFSRSYLDGDAGQGRFISDLCLTIAAVLLVVLAGNVVQLGAAWLGTSLALHRLLMFYRDRPAARRAARKKFIVARTGDVALVTALVLLVFAFGTGDIVALTDAARATSGQDHFPVSLTVAAGLIALAAMLKSAMFPTHGWLLEVMETPTPVSALLHAGLINAGTFLVVRLGDVVLASDAAVIALMVVGGLTALFASAAMVTQSSVKVSLAYSSAAHMGFMLMVCGFGAHSVAILHLIAHSFYKAHAFLSSGSAVEYARHTEAARGTDEARVGSTLVAFFAAAVTFTGIGFGLGRPWFETPAGLALGGIFIFALTHLLARGLTLGTAGGALRIAVVARTAVAGAVVALAFFTLEAGASFILGASVATPLAAGAARLSVMGLLVAAFGAVVLAQLFLPVLAHTDLGRRAYVHLKRGLYANALFDRLLPERLSR
jgi:NAD(P)H-quinone oxidoreductase subunit 5